MGVSINNSAGPTNNGDGALDADGEIIVNGGELLAVGSAGMAQVPADSSTQIGSATAGENTGFTQSGMPGGGMGGPGGQMPGGGAGRGGQNQQQDNSTQNN